MQFFSGLNKTDYQDVFRAIGLFADEQGWRSVRLMEVDDGILVQGMQTDSTGYLGVGFRSRLFSDDDIRQILVDAYRRRGVQPPPEPLPFPPRRRGPRGPRAAARDGALARGRIGTRE